MLIDTHPGDPYVPDAWLGKAMVLIDQGHLDTALEAYQEGMDRYPESEQAPKSAWDVVEHLDDVAGLLAGLRISSSTWLIAIPTMNVRRRRASRRGFTAIAPEISRERPLRGRI